MKNITRLLNEERDPLNPQDIWIQNRIKEAQQIYIDASNKRKEEYDEMYLCSDECREQELEQRKNPVHCFSLRYNQKQISEYLEGK